ncbi:MAG: hypothetical protein KAI74_03990 [Kiritimatiellae bacterium]|nr:hypothetical protein [Kiritimatiellia bacterium]
MLNTINNLSFAQLVFSALLITFKFGIVGMGWGAVLAQKLAGDRSRVERLLISLTLSIVCSTLFTLLLTVLLATFDLYTPPVEWVCLLSFLFSGILFDVVKKKNALLSAVPGMVFLFLAFLSIMALPKRGEWLVGGWDPGVYLNQGISMANNDSRMHKGLTFSELNGEEQLLFRHDRHNRKQFAPGILVDDEAKALRFQFFPLTPSLSANLYRCGGVRAATRMNHFAAVMSLLTIACFLILVSSSFHALLAVFILCLQPIFLWHLQMPISEMLQQFIVFGMLIAYSNRDKGVGFMLLVFLSILASVLNRFSFLPFAGMLLAAGAVSDRLTYGAALTKETKTKHLLYVGLLIAAGALSWYSSPVAVGGWSGSIATGILSLTALSMVVVVFAMFAPLDKIVVRLKQVPLGYMSILWLLWVPFFIFAPPIMFRIEETVDQHNLIHALYYIGIVIALCAWGGTILVWLFRKTSNELRTYLLFATAVISVLMLRKFIEPIYPWATRRYLHILVPCIAIMASYFLSHVGLLFHKGKKIISVICCLILLAGIIELIPKDKAAIRGVEFDGIATILSGVDEVIPENAIILVDHFLYATPLTCVYNRDVLIISDMDKKDLAVKKEKLDKALKVLARLSLEKPIYIFTVTEEGLDFFPSKIDVDEEILFDQELVIKKMIHHRNRHSFEMQSSTRRFRVYKAIFK